VAVFDLFCNEEVVNIVEIKKFNLLGKIRQNKKNFNWEII